MTDLTRTTFTYLPQDAPVAFDIYITVCEIRDALMRERAELLAERDRTHALIRRLVALDTLAQHGAPKSTKAQRRAAIQALAERVDPT